MNKIIYKDRGKGILGQYNRITDDIELCVDNISDQAMEDGVFDAEYRQLVLYHEMFHRLQNKRYVSEGWSRTGWEWYFESRADRYAMMRYRHEIGSVPDVKGWYMRNRRPDWNKDLILRYKLKGGCHAN